MIVGTAITGAATSSPFQLVIFRFAFRQAEAPAVVVYYDLDMIRIVERRGAALERGVVEIPLWRCDLPDEFRKVAAVFVITGAAALR